jgi:D-proline reductase (dithiol) PrdB
MDTPSDIPWTPLAKPLRDSTVALLSSAGVALKSDPPFDQDIERHDPWFSDPSYRVIPQQTSAQDVKVYHLHINGALAEQDVNCILPLQALADMQARGDIGRAAPSHYSYMGYTVRPQRLLSESVPAIVRQLKEERVDVVVLAPV